MTTLAFAVLRADQQWMIRVAVSFMGAIMQVGSVRSCFLNDDKRIVTDAWNS
jgi:hypothetical protein